MVLTQLHSDAWACVALHVADVEALACVCTATHRAVTRVVDVVEANGTHRRAVDVHMRLDAPCGFLEEQHVHLHLGEIARVSLFFGHTCADELRLMSLTFYTPQGACYVPCDMAHMCRVDVRVQRLGSLCDIARTHNWVRKELVLAHLRRRLGLA
jgi:hypothetical protein